MQNSKYLVATDHDRQWGLTVSTIGYEEIAPNDSYPTQGHADGYYFNLDKGRILNEYQLLYITEGEGYFSSSHQEKINVKAGDIFILFPGEWHTYYPEKEKGWKCNWIGFMGRNMDNRVKAGFLSLEKPIFHIGFSTDVINLYNTAFHIAQEEATFAQQMLAGIVNHLIGIIYYLERNLILSENQSQVEMINKARMIIRQNLESDMSIQEIASKLNIGYSKFRKLFKEIANISPSLYQQDLRIQRAKELLSTTDESIKEIAFKLNFESADYFSSKFKKKTGMKPSEFRDLSK